MLPTHIPKVMSTQHPDNVRPPFFGDNSIVEGDDEIKEAFYVFSHLNAEEQLWDCEGKEVDNFVIKKLFSRYEPFFRNHRLGRDRFLTLRVPNPGVEKSEAKLLLETLDSIPRSFDLAKLFYGDEVCPIFEVCLPMAENHLDLLRISHYYKKYVYGKQSQPLTEGDVPISEWIGKFAPEKIRVTPLFEEKDSMLNAADEVRKYIQKDKIDDIQRVWLARSDPALNYGSLGAVLLEKIAVQRLHKLEQESSIKILPILGCGSAPFRGNLKPTNVKDMLKGYPSVHTYTIQSAFKYDYDENIVREAIKTIDTAKRGAPIPVDEKAALALLDKTASEYQRQIKEIAPLINSISSHIPKRRKRKLHIGLFGYSRSSGGVTLPRAITFTAAMYSFGLPPEALGLGCLEKEDIKLIGAIYPGFQQDLRDAMRYVNKDNLDMLPDSSKKAYAKAIELANCDTDENHKKITSIIRHNLSKGHLSALSEDITRAGWLRGFLG